ncbi:unnamed protein product [Angiostrongylus costaricensis]|uniref:Transmembrane protein 26 n=1 Tax=Angiostrongylus costaricensis TaxID=334426 RepID=A0A0R3PLU2_ANGCS|nr:unnamed protein product [Angiostrongylus costaricensis]
MPFWKFQVLEIELVVHLDFPTEQIRTLAFLWPTTGYTQCDETLLQPETRVEIEGRHRHSAGNGQRRVADMKSTVDVDEAQVLISVCRFCTSLFLYILATAPPIWLHETKICEWRRQIDLLGENKVRTARYNKVPNSGELEQELELQLLEQLLLVVLIIGRWLLPKGDISREQLSQILLAYLAISSDIVEFFDVFKEKPVYNNISVQRIVLAAWTLSLLQFPFVLTVSRARKMRVAITKTYEELMLPRRPQTFWEIFHDVDLWAIVLANSLQDIPFLLVRLYLMLQYGLITYTMIFFTCKNALIIALQTYRAFVLLNDRYIHPKSPALDILEPHHMHHIHNHPRKPTGTKKKPRKRKMKRGKSEERQHLFSPNRERRLNRRKMDILEETTA